MHALTYRFSDERLRLVNVFDGSTPTLIFRLLGLESDTHLPNICHEWGREITLEEMEGIRVLVKRAVGIKLGYSNEHSDVETLTEIQLFSCPNGSRARSASRNRSSLCRLCFRTAGAPGQWLSPTFVEESHPALSTPSRAAAGMDVHRTVMGTLAMWTRPRSRSSKKMTYLAVS